MKATKWIVLVSIMVCLFFGALCYVHEHDSTFVRENFVLYTSIEKFVEVSQYHNNYQSYFHAIITNDDKSRLLKENSFQDSLMDPTSVLHLSFISQNSNFQYCKHSNVGVYGLVIFALEKEGNSLIVYEHYGD